MPRTDEYSRLCGTDKKRKQCMAAVQSVAGGHGATVYPHEFNGPREIGLELVYGPYACMIHFEGGSRVGAFLGHWHMNRAADSDRSKTYPDTFWRVGSLNPYHKQKATTCCDTFGEFLTKLAEGLELLKAA